MTANVISDPFEIGPRGSERGQGRCQGSERWDFFRAWLANPLRGASIVPSSHRLALAITQEISCATGPVLELGPGTGVFTRALLARGVAEKDLVWWRKVASFFPVLASNFLRRTFSDGCSRLAPDRSIKGWRRDQWPAAAFNAAAASRCGPARIVPANAPGRCLLSVHLRTTLPRSTPALGNAWAQSCAYQYHLCQPAAGQCLLHHETLKRPDEPRRKSNSPVCGNAFSVNYCFTIDAAEKSLVVLGDVVA